MRDDTRKRLERAIWMERAKKIGIGAAICGAIALVFAYQSLDLKVTNSQIAGTVTEIDPLVSKTSAADGETVHVKLADGHAVQVLALKSRHIKIGEQIDVTEHHHATGRVTYTLK